ncbi:MAG: DUF488 domain-containing protein [Anaerolineae bacterium]
MMTLYTIGYQGKPLATFVYALRDAGVDAVIDMRLHNTSQLAGYTKRDDLAFLLREGFGIAYEHLPALAPTEEILVDYRRTKDWTAYEERFAGLMAERPVEVLGREVLGREVLGRYGAPCLLCAEATAEYCHRRLIAQRWAEAVRDLVVTHL